MAAAATASVIAAAAAAERRLPRHRRNPSINSDDSNFCFDSVVNARTSQDGSQDYMEVTVKAEAGAFPAHLLTATSSDSDIPPIVGTGASHVYPLASSSSSDLPPPPVHSSHCDPAMTYPPRSSNYAATAAASEMALAVAEVAAMATAAAAATLAATVAATAAATAASEVAAATAADENPTLSTVQETHPVIADGLASGPLYSVSSTASSLVGPP